MKQWHYVNQQVYDQFTFYVWANDWLEAERIYKTNKLPVKCNFCGFVLTDTEKKYYLSETVTAVSIDKALKQIDKNIEEKIKQSIVYREGKIKIKVCKKAIDK